MGERGGTPPGPRHRLALVLPRDPRRLRRGPDNAGGPARSGAGWPRPVTPHASYLRSSPGRGRRRADRRVVLRVGPAFLPRPAGGRRRPARRPPFRPPARGPAPRRRPPPPNG